MNPSHPFSLTKKLSSVSFNTWLVHSNTLASPPLLPLPHTYAPKLTEKAKNAITLPQLTPSTNVLLATSLYSLCMLSLVTVHSLSENSRSVVSIRIFGVALMISTILSAAVFAILLSSSDRRTAGDSPKFFTASTPAPLSGSSVLNTFCVTALFCSALTLYCAPFGLAITQKRLFFSVVVSFSNKIAFLFELCRLASSLLYTPLTPTAMVMIRPRKLAAEGRAVELGESPDPWRSRTCSTVECSMALLASQQPPGEGWVTVGETECRFLARRAGEEDSYPDRGLYPDIYVDADTSLVGALEDHTHHFLPVTENWLKRALNIWRYKGTWSVIEDLAGNQGLSGSIVGKTAGHALSLLQWGRRFCGWFAPQRYEMSVYELTLEYSEVADWENSPVRAMALHPRLPFIALARKDDAIEIKSLAQLQDQGLVLRDKSQELVCCLKWAPHCSTLLAAGTSTGVLLWNVDPSVTTSRFLTSWVRVESSPNHSPVSSISWSPHGNFLISGSPADTNLIVWDIPMGVATRVRRTEGGGVNLVRVSPDGQWVFAASVGNVLRVWETENWTCEKWTHFGGRCKVACWSPRGDFLLFALEGDHALYYLGFHGNNTSAAGPVSAVKCSDLSPCIHVVNGQEVVVGGCVQTMSWDPTGERLAVIFTSDSPGSDLVAVLRTRLTTMLEILPGGFVRGEEGDRPQLVSFQQNCSHGAVMATAWVSGRVSFTPLHFTSTLHPPHLPTPDLPPHFPHGPRPPQPHLFSSEY